MHNFDLALLRELRETSGQLAHDVVFPFAQLERINFGSAKCYAVLGHGFGFVNDFGCMQQRLGRYAANVQAHAAQPVPTFNKNDLHAEICGAKRGCIATRAGTNNDELRRVRRILRSGTERGP